MNWMFFRKKGREKERYCYRDKQHGTVIVTDKERVRYLKFGNHIKQGAMNLRQPDRVHLQYQQVMLRVFDSEAYSSCLCLGLGAGTIPKYIHQQGLCERMEVVEINPVVIDVARRYFALPGEVTVHNCDAMDFVVGTNRQFDLVMVDLFDKSGTPLEFKRLSFYRKLFGLLRRGGMVVINMWASDFGDLLLEEKLGTVFDQVEVVRADRNHITLCRRKR